MNQVQCRVDVLRCQSVGGLTPARAFWKSYNGICLYMTQFYLTSSHTDVLQWNYGWKSWLGFEEGLWGWGVAIVTGDGCPHESLTMNDPSLSLRHTHTHSNPYSQWYPFPHTHVQKQVHLQILPSVVLYGAASPVDTTLLFWHCFLYLQIVIYLHFGSVLYQNNVQFSTALFPF